MHIPESLLPLVWSSWAQALLGVIGLWALWTAPWARLRDGAQATVWIVACLSLLLLWNLRPVPALSMNFHLLGATAFTLMFGPRLAILGLSIVIGTLCATDALAPEAFAVNVLMLVIVPVGVSQAVLFAAERYLPPNLFVYLFVTAFFGAALAMGAGGVGAAGLIVALGAPQAAWMAEQFLPYCLLLAFAEATLTGMVITLFVVYRPQWVGTFDDARYLRRA